MRVLAITRYNLDHSLSDHDCLPRVSSRNSGVTATEAELITNGVNTDIFHPMDGSAMRSALGIAPDAFVLGFAGAIERWYALDEVIRSFRRFSSGTRTPVSGEVGGSLFTGYMDELQALAARLGVSGKVHFTGTVDYNDLPAASRRWTSASFRLPPQWVDIALPNSLPLLAIGVREADPLTPIPDMLRMGGDHITVYRGRAGVP